ncbi:MAG: TonB-dependent receptor, partial [Sulfurovum sp.]
QIKTSVINISPQQMKKLPSIGGEPDFAQYLQILPGVVSSGDQGGQLYIRGGSPIQNKVLMDGMTIYQPFHSIGFFSVFDSDIIRNADVYTGGFNAQYGGRISSIMDISMRDGNKKKFSGKASATTFGGKLMLEGPIKKQTMESNGSSSYILSAKTSYLDKSSTLFYNYVNDGEGLPFDYTDLYGKVSFNAKNGSKISLFGFNYTDHVKYQAISDLNWRNYGFGTSMSLVPANSKAIIKINASFSDYKIALANTDNLPRESGSNGFNFGLGFIYYLGKNQLDYGVEIGGGKTTFDFYNSAGMHIEQEDNVTNLSFYGKMKFTFGKLLIEPGLRIISYVSAGEISPEPRIGAKYNATDFLRFKLAGGFYSQNLIAINSDRDVVNLFSGFVSTPQSLPSTYRGEEVTSKLQKSKHLIIGTEVDLMKHLSLNVEGYYKLNSQLININKNKIYSDVPSNAQKEDYYKKDFIIETGNAYGVDFLLFVFVLYYKLPY